MFKNAVWVLVNPRLCRRLTKGSTTEQFGDEHTLNLTFAFADFVDFHAKQVSRNGVFVHFVHEAIAAMNLDRLVGDAFRC